MEPPAGAAVGERVYVEGFPGEPDEQLNPKKKIWEAVSAYSVHILLCIFCAYSVHIWRMVSAYYISGTGRWEGRCQGQSPGCLGQGHTHKNGGVGGSVALRL